ncbi:MAG TPA: PLP-dependent aminotransferase family protein [Solirubrobacteraceae bacterium]|jgi:GntR family transcriptional regulator/MocR family aminotransferase|nr:PLP-dependent aminotransferase family protein [Solirubrobacteraceae bacterium]
MDLHLDLSDLSGGSLRTRVERALREAVRSGRLPPGSRLPSTRALCVQLGVSRGVLVDAYSQLAAEGYLQTRRGGGTRVTGTAMSAGASSASVTPAGAVRYDFNPYRPALDGFPRAAWLSALTRVLRGVPDERLAYPDPAGTPELRASLAAYLGRVRGVRATPDQIVVTGGTRQGVELLWSVLVGDGARRVAVEQPGWRGMSETAVDAGLLTLAVPVDEHGLVVERLRDEQVDAVALAPAHQFPTGAVLCAARRLMLVEWARAHDTLIVEDDYDAEYRYDRQPIGSLQGLAPEHVAYAGSTSKTLAPAIRLGWLVLMPRLAEQVAVRQRRRGSMPSPLNQLALSDLIERGELDRHLRRQRRRYSRRREVLLEALARELPEARVSGAAAGLYVVVGLPDGISEQAALVAARSRGIALEGVGGPSPAFVLGYANLADAAVVPAVEALAASLRDAGKPSSTEARYVGSKRLRGGSRP